jgi:hypothetical protein
MSADSVNPRALELLRFAATQQRHADALARATGERFNIFQILRVGHLEVTTHSPVLGELLNPKGRHGQGAAFLRLFLTRFEIRGFNAETATVKLEYQVGQITDKSGGRIDIVVKDSKGATILIENKIYAGDQDNQMTRYRAFDQEAELFYLTLDRREPSSCGEVPNIRCISYAVDILAWIKDCRKEVACVHTVREILSHYIHLIQELTHQNPSTLMNQELIKAVLESKESFLAYTALCNAALHIREGILNSLFEKLDEIAKEFGLQLERPVREMSQKDGGFYFSAPELQANNLRIGFEFDAGDYRAFFFGFKYVKSVDTTQDCARTQQIRALFQIEFGEAEDRTIWWATWLRWGLYPNWSDDVFAAIQFGVFVDEFKMLLQQLLKVAKQATLI